MAERILTASYIRNAMIQSEDWLKRGILAIYKKQTFAEQQAEETKEDNGVGFSGCDAKILTSFAKQIERGGTLSPKQKAIALNKMLKYSNQLLKIAKGEI